MWDVIVVGCGGAGLSLMWELSRRGQRVLGLEASADAANPQANSSSSSRGHRQTYEDPLYRSLAKRSARMWSRLRPRAPLYVQSGAWLVGHPEHPMVSSVQRTLLKTQAPHRVHPEHDVLGIAPEAVALWEPDAGWIDAQGAMDAWRRQALDAGARLRTGARVASVRPGDRRVDVVLDSGESHTARRVVWCTGEVACDGTEPGSPGVERQTEFWCEVPASFDLPMFHWLDMQGAGCFGVLERPGCLKVCLHGIQEPTQGASWEQMSQALGRALPSLGPVRLLRAQVKSRAMTPDREFMVGPTNSARNVWVFGGLCGHGFKMLPALAHDLAGALTGREALPQAWGRFDPRRMRRQAAV